MPGCLSQHSHFDALLYLLPVTELVQMFYNIKYNSRREVGNCKKQQKFISKSVSLKGLQLPALVSNWQKKTPKPKRIIASLFRAD